ncbi:hypothetical protein CEXT_808481 [Caerostris extrusa]|uniref:Uncharacterized protein n=1 Tax=Caerostris extrusa TaxID=172846 RepID=A0AAV4S2E8_CAEEX|nr:hypothetical protein CEXT_808481 [Caerostris extrusa]
MRQQILSPLFTTALMIYLKTQIVKHANESNAIQCTKVYMQTSNVTLVITTKVLHELREDYCNELQPTAEFIIIFAQQSTTHVMKSFNNCLEVDTHVLYLEASSIYMEIQRGSSCSGGVTLQREPFRSRIRIST